MSVAHIHQSMAMKTTGLGTTPRWDLGDDFMQSCYDSLKDTWSGSTHTVKPGGGMAKDLTVEDGILLTDLDETNELIPLISTEQVAKKFEASTLLIGADKVRGWLVVSIESWI